MERPMPHAISEPLNVFREWGALLARNIVPICEKDARGDTQGHGTGLLVTSRGLNFLVTAAHALDPLIKGRRLFIPCATFGERDFLGSKMIATIPPDGQFRLNDGVDIAVVKLEGDAQPPYLDIGKECLDLSWLRPASLPREGKSLFVTGYPATRVKTHRVREEVTMQPLGVAGMPMADDEYEAFGLEPAMSIVLPFDVNRVFNGSGPPITSADPKGLSGSPIWLLYDDPSENDGSEKQVVGIVIEHRRKNKFLVGTDISVAIDMIEELS